MSAHNTPQHLPHGPVCVEVLETLDIFSSKRCPLGRPTREHVPSAVLPLPLVLSWTPSSFAFLLNSFFQARPKRSKAQSRLNDRVFQLCVSAVTSSSSNRNIPRLDKHADFVRMFRVIPNSVNQFLDCHIRGLRTRNHCSESFGELQQ